jgi:hypothetical protein
MEIKKIKCKSGNEYNIVNEYWETSNSWGHKSTLIAPWGEVESKKVRYYNRTWECYTYQSCMSNLISTILENNLKSYITQVKEIRGITRLLKGTREEIENDWNNKEYTQDLKEIQERIKNRNFD